MRRSTNEVALGAAAALVIVCACSKKSSDQEGADRTRGTAKEDGRGPAASGSQQVEVFSWWTGPGEQEGLSAMIEVFEGRNPGIEFINAAVSGGAGTNAKAILANRLQAGNPPDSYQRHAGFELVDDIKAGKLEDLNGLYAEKGWKDKLPSGLLDAITIEGKIYSVPVNIHRANLIWYSPRVLKELGIAGPPKTWNEFLRQAATIKKKGKTPLAIGPLWTQKHLLETVLLGELGPQKYTGLWNGNTDWKSPEVLAAVEVFSKVLSFSDVKSAAADWQPAADRVIDGAAVYTVMGDWLDAYWGRAKKLEFETDYDVAPSPGSAGVYDFLSDSFTLPVDAARRDAAIRWLEVCGSVEGQDAFNPQKGSVPARIDADERKYKGYLATALEAWRDHRTKIVGSLTHGVVASNALNAEIDTALGLFLARGDARAFVNAVAKAYVRTT